MVVNKVHYISALEFSTKSCDSYISVRSYLCSRPRSLSPTLTTMTSLPVPVRLAISLLMVLATPEWMAPQSPRSEVTPTIRCLPALSSGALISAFSYRAGGENSGVSDTGSNPTRTKRTNTEAHTQSTSAVDSGRLQLLLSTSILGSGHHFHGLGDFLDVLDGLQPNGDWKQEIPAQLMG